jgi:hypothetical protein
VTLSSHQDLSGMLRLEAVPENDSGGDKSREFFVDHDLAVESPVVLVQSQFLYELNRGIQVPSVSLRK